MSLFIPFRPNLNDPRWRWCYGVSSWTLLCYITLLAICISATSCLRIDIEKKLVYAYYILRSTG